MSAVAGALVVAVDGPSGSGKSTVSRRLAQALGVPYLDTGSMYRAVTWAVLRADVDLHDTATITKIAAAARLTVGTDPADPHIAVDGTGVDGATASVDADPLVTKDDLLSAIAEIGATG